MLNLKESYIKITDNLNISDATTNDIEYKLLCLGNKINIYGQISIIEKKYVIHPLCGDKIYSSGWYDMEKDEINIYCRLIEYLINSKGLTL